MPLSGRAAIDFRVLAGPPAIRMARLALEFIVPILAAGRTENGMPASYPGRVRESMPAGLHRAK